MCWPLSPLLALGAARPAGLPLPPHVCARSAPSPPTCPLLVVQPTGVPLVDELMKLPTLAAATQRSLHLLLLLGGLAACGRSAIVAAGWLLCCLGAAATLLWLRGLAACGSSVLQWYLACSRSRPPLTQRRVGVPAHVPTNQHAEPAAASHTYAACCCAH